MRIYLSSIIFILFCGCLDKSTHFEKNIAIEREGWSYDQLLVYDVPIENIADTMNLYINVRHNRQYQWRNLWVKIHTLLPNGEKLSRRINLKLESSKGESFGECTGDICFVQIPIQYKAIFPDTGLYRFTIEQSMRVDPLKNIEHIGFRVEKLRFE